VPLVTRRRLRPLALLCLSFAAVALPHAARAQTPAPTPAASLERLREDFAMRFLEPEPHMALARYFRDTGDPVAAFNVLEIARRGRFPEEVFDEAFKTHFLGEKPFANDTEAEAKLLAQLAREPDSNEVLFNLADIYISREDWPKAKQYLLKLIARAPDDFAYTEALARVFSEEHDEQESQRILRAWASAHPGTAESYRIRVEEIPEAETDRRKALLAEAAAKFPGDPSFSFYLAGIHLRENNLKEAERLYVRAAELSPDSAFIQTWVGRFFFKAMPDDRRALEHYLKAYLLDPHAYETEYVESRIPKLLWRMAEARMDEQRKLGVPLSKLLEDPNHFVVIIALSEMAKAWKPDYQKTLVELMAHRDVGVRWTATQLLKEKADASFDPTLRALLQDKDLIRRGLAAYIAVHRWKAASFDLMRQMLREEAQILRFDAASALLMEGGPAGRKIAFDHAAREPHPRLREVIEAAKKAGPPEQEP
jgi:tetratricopeptide (TPR) repeat protein